MNHYDRVLKSSVDHTLLSVSIYEPSEPEVANGVLQLVHGMCEHKERYVPFITYLVNQGYICVIHDHRGHGSSIANDDELGYFGPAGYKGMIADVLTVTEFIREEVSSYLPLYLLGHSMGSMVVRSFTKRYDNLLSGLLVVGSPSYNIGSKIGKSVAKAASALRGERHRSEILRRLSFIGYTKPFTESDSPNRWICSDTDVVERYDADSRCNFNFTTNGYENLYGVMQDCYSKDGWAMSRPKLPIQFISGAEDPCIINAKAFDKAVAFMKRVGYRDVQGKLYEGMRHEILNERGKEEVWAFVLETLNRWNGKKL